MDPLVGVGLRRSPEGKTDSCVGAQAPVSGKRARADLTFVPHRFLEIKQQWETEEAQS